MHGYELRRRNGLSRFWHDIRWFMPVRCLGLFRRVQSDRHIGSFRHIHATGHDTKRVIRKERHVSGNSDRQHLSTIYILQDTRVDICRCINIPIV